MVSVSTCSIPLKSLHMMPDNLFLVFNGQLLVGFSDGLGWVPETHVLGFLTVDTV